MGGILFIVMVAVPVIKLPFNGAQLVVLIAAVAFMNLVAFYLVSNVNGFYFASFIYAVIALAFCAVAVVAALFLQKICIIIYIITCFLSIFIYFINVIIDLFSSVTTWEMTVIYATTAFFASISQLLFGIGGYMLLIDPRATMAFKFGGDVSQGSEQYSFNNGAASEEPKEFI